MLLHLFDDEKVVNRSIELFEKAFPNNNIFVCFLHSKPSKYVAPHRNLYFYSQDELISKELLYKVDKVLIHYLSDEKMNFINYYLNSDISCYWLMWGGDLYNEILAYEGFSIYYESRFLGLKFLVLTFLSKLGLRFPYRQRRLNFIKNRISYFVSGPDFEVAKKYIGQYINGQQVRGFSYYSIDTILGPLKDERVQGNNILIGNSASFTNNHVYAFKYLSKLKLGGRKVFVPLSYGGTERYKKHVVRRGGDKLGNAFSPLFEFLPLNDYNKLMLSIGICIFSSWRQEAFGNIVVALYLGAKIFMAGRSPLYHFLKKQNLIIYELESIQQSDIDFPLCDAQKMNNRKIIENMLCEETILNNILRIWG